jgi:hypothetical protein
MDGFDPAADDCPETFRLDLRLDEFGHSADDLFLIRVEAARFIARLAGVSMPDLQRLMTVVSDGMRHGRDDPAARQDLDDILFRWQGWLDNRPVFAAYWDDAQPVLADPQPGWADELRDRLGLIHLSPDPRTLGAELDVVVFRYPIRLIPRHGRKGPRLLLRPTVLDGALSEAFCTAPAGTGTGSTVDLAGEHRNDAPWQEILHPAIEMRSEHVWAIDTIKKGAPADLSGPRAYHLIKLYDHAMLDFQSLIELTDSDLM